MTLRSLSLVGLAAASLATFCAGMPVGAAPGEVRASFAPVQIVPPSQVAVDAYRRYAKIQAGTLAGMTRVLLEEIKAGNVDAAQSAYAPAHRYFQRIKPIVDLLGPVGQRMDARADSFALREADPAFSGFHRIEYGLFAGRSTAGLLADAERLCADARELQATIQRIDLKAGVLADAAAGLARQIADKTLDGSEERYSRTDLWDFEANVEAVQQIVALLQAEPRNGRILAHTSVHFARIGQLLEKQKDGCGFKAFDEVGNDDRAALKTAVAALADELSTLRGTLAMD